MAYHTETRTFTIEVEVTATATIETGGGYSDEPEWAEIDEIVIDKVEFEGNTIAAIGNATSVAIRDAAYEEFSE